MKIRTVLSCAMLLLTLGFSTVSAQTPTSQPAPRCEHEAATAPKSTEWAATLIFGLFKRYPGTNGAPFTEEPVTQNELDLGWKNGRFSGAFMLWFSKSLDRSGTFGDETDGGATFSRSGFLDVTGTFWYFKLIQSAKADILTANVKVSKTFTFGGERSLQPYFKVENYWSTKEAEIKGGKFAAVGATFTRKHGERLALNLHYEFKRDIDGAFGFRRANIHAGDISLDISLGGGWTMSPKFGLAVGQNDPKRPLLGTPLVTFTKTFKIHP